MIEMKTSIKIALWICVLSVVGIPIAVIIWWVSNIEERIKKLENKR